MIRRISIAIALACTVAVVTPTFALADFQDLYDEYLQDGIFACAHSQAELEDALSSIPADIAAYDPSFANSLNAALEQRAVGCVGAREGLKGLLDEAALGTVVADDGSPGPAPPTGGSTAALPAAGSSASDLPVALILGAGILLSGLVVAAVAGPKRSPGRGSAQGRARGFAEDLVFVAKRSLRR